ncbi:UDP-N-acetylmuramoyl-tripeptide--D-alanyl-D-alanine ligase [Marinomonas posidonica]|uniref:UDP-N-acetylmuramoyl-tripeptide--D-alanyl-D-alanine ligase n=1 Tax=Marinomonas posidonica (strain CECT 7376 / NCIMB 14433 / IVIA-Po-181) TaxID=491952 RepID=F6CXE2_MARPP|nr:UDP-N-acetylmuramoyl-tripeptide--D-alanyl-D-alanine ligase [Marinomonas posidonica]AEF54495.1 UDP-N-acetylmuramoylalanyl-D-glutamyl-2,6-diaminopimelate/D-alanyl-D-alanyl ligase [Marinomonas posidonica IVIA-Po-181]
MLVSLSLKDIAFACDGELVGDNQLIREVVTDTRRIVPGCLFVALRGERFDGHDFADQAMSAGAVCVLSEIKLEGVCHVKVANTLEAYGRVANLVRQAFAGPVICITGSNGKTTVKDWLAQSLAGQNVLKTRANLNNQIGLPQTLLELQPYHQVAVIEAGTNYPGEIANLARIAVPDVVILTNASGSHFEGLGSLEGIAKEKGCLISGAAEQATVILNSDDGFFDYWCGLAGQRKVYSFGFTEQADLYAKHIELGADSSRAILCYQGESLSALIASPGRHQIANGMAMVLALLSVGFSFAAAVATLAQPIQVAGRMERLKTKKGALLINDCYNANPTSVKAAIDVLTMQSAQSTWLVLGGLGELGERQNEFHAELGEYAKAKGITNLVCLGSLAAIAGEAFKQQGGSVYFCENHEEAAVVVQELNENHAILVKGSRSAKMEKIIERLKD